MSAALRRGLAGTGQLVRLALRRDRVRLPVWMAALVGIAAAVVASVRGLYPTAQEREEAARFVAANVATRLVDGPASGTDIGSLAWTETYGILAILIGLMAIQTVLRHTRQDEDTGRAELLGATAIGRRAPLTAALSVAFGASLVAGGAVTVALLGQGLAAAGSVAAGGALAAAGMVFAAVAAVAAQVMSSHRGATMVSVAAPGWSALGRAHRAPAPPCAAHSGWPGGCTGGCWRAGWSEWRSWADCSARSATAPTRSSASATSSSS